MFSRRKLMNKLEKYSIDMIYESHHIETPSKISVDILLCEKIVLITYGSNKFDNHGGILSFDENARRLGAAIDINFRDLGFGSTVLVER